MNEVFTGRIRQTKWIISFKASTWLISGNLLQPSWMTQGSQLTTRVLSWYAINPHHHLIVHWPLRRIFSNLLLAHDIRNGWRGGWYCVAIASWRRRRRDYRGRGKALRIPPVHFHYLFTWHRRSCEPYFKSCFHQSVKMVSMIDRTERERGTEGLTCT